MIKYKLFFYEEVFAKENISFKFFLQKDFVTTVKYISERHSQNNYFGIE